MQPNSQNASRLLSATALVFLLAPGMNGLTADAALTPKSDGFDFCGRVLGPEGKPVEGAKLYVIYPTPARLPPPEVRAVTDAGGNFRFAMAKSEFDKSQDSDPWATACIVAVAPRHGVDEASAICFEVSGTLKEAVKSIPTYDLEALGKRVRETSATLRLVRDDVPLEGRIVDPGGRPVVGATVRVLEFTAPENEDLTPWLEAVQRGEDYDVTREVLDGGGKMIVPAASQQFQHILPAATTDAEGRFRMEGIGREPRRTSSRPSARSAVSAVKSTMGSQEFSHLNSLYRRSRLPSISTFVEERSASR
jgi:hypothetical protein